MNKIEITNDQWLLADHMGAIFTFTGTTNERIAALKKQLKRIKREESFPTHSSLLTKKEPFH